MIYWGSNSIFVTVQPSASLLRNPAHLKFAFAKGWILWLNLRILTDFAAGAKSWAELLLAICFSLMLKEIPHLPVCAKKADIL